MTAAIENLIRLTKAIKEKQWHAALTELVNGWQTVTRKTPWDTITLETMLAEAFLPAPDTSSECLLLAAARSNGNDFDRQLDRIVELARVSQQALNPDEDPLHQWWFQSILLRTQTIQLFRRDLPSTALTDRLGSLLVDYRKLWSTHVWKQVADAPAGRPAALKELAKHNTRLTQSIDALTKQVSHGWQDPAAVFLCDTLLALSQPTAGVVAANARLNDGIGTTWILIAVDNALKQSPEPGGLVLQLRIEVIPDGCGILYPHPSAAAHVVPSRSFQVALRNAWSVVLGKALRRQFATSNGTPCDYRWRLTVMDDTTEFSSKEKLHLRHLQRRQLIGRQLEGRSGEVAIASALRSAVERTPLDQSRAVSGRFVGIMPVEDNPLLKPISSLLQKAIGIRNLPRRSMTLAGIDHIVLAPSQTIPGEFPFKRVDAADFNTAFGQLSREALMTSAFKTMQTAAAEKWFETECFGLESYVPNAICWSSDTIQLLDRKPSKPELTHEERSAIHTGNLDFFRLHVRELRESSQPRVALRIVAESGMGKSTLLASCEHTVNAGLDHRIAIRIEHMIDIMHEKSAKGFLDLIFNNELRESLRRAFRESYPRHVVPDDGDLSEWLKRKAELGEVVWLLDAMDQMSDHRSNVRVFAKAFSLCPVLLTMRPESLTDFATDMADQNTQWLTAELQQFSEHDGRSYLGSEAYDFFASHLPRRDHGSTDDHHVLAIPLLLRLLRDLIEGNQADDLADLPQLKNRYSIYDQVMHVEGGLLHKGWVSLQERERDVRGTFTDFRDVLECTQQTALEQLSRHQFDTKLQGADYQAVRKKLEMHFGKHAKPAVEQIDVLGRLRPVFDDAAGGQHQTNLRSPQRTHRNLTQDGLKWRHRSFLEFHAGCRLADLFASEDSNARAQADAVLLDIHSFLDAQHPDQTRTNLDSQTGTGIRDLPADWRDTLRFALCHLKEGDRHRLAKRLLELGNFGVVQSAITDDHIEFTPEINRFAEWMKSAFENPPQDSTRLLATVDKNQLLNRATRQAEWLWPLRRIVVPQHQLYPSTSQDQLLLDRLAHLHSGDATWNFLESFAALESGTFDLSGYTDHKHTRPQQQQIERFVMADFPVTNELFELFCPTHRRHRDRYSNADDQPVVHVTWFMAQEFCEWLSSLTGQKYRLPSEWEWEWACRWHNTLRETYWWGDEMRDEICWYNGSSGRAGTRRRCDTIRALSVSPFAPRKIADASFAERKATLFDMSGNVWEWCENPYSADADPSDPGSSRVLRGGSWDGFADSCVPGFRGDRTPGHRGYYIGFRLCVE